jgi:hypothetical protein
MIWSYEKNRKNVWEVLETTVWKARIEKEYIECEIIIDCSTEKSVIWLWCDSDSDNNMDSDEEFSEWSLIVAVCHLVRFLL